MLDFVLIALNLATIGVCVYGMTERRNAERRAQIAARYPGLTDRKD